MAEHLEYSYVDGIDDPPVMVISHIEDDPPRDVEEYIRRALEMDAEEIAGDPVMEAKIRKSARARWELLERGEIERAKRYAVPGYREKVKRESVELLRSILAGRRAARMVNVIDDADLSEEEREGLAQEPDPGISETDAAHLFAGLREHMQAALRTVSPAGFDFNENGTARLIVELLIGWALYVPELGGMLFYDGAKGIWRRADLIPECVRFAAEVINGLPITDADEVKERWKHVGKLLTAQGVRSVEYLVCKDPRITSSPDRFDCRRDIIVFSNGTYELEVGALREHRASDFATLCTNGRHDAAAKAPLFEKVVREALEDREDDVRFLQKWGGYALSGYTDEQAALFVIGPTNTSKSTIFTAIHHAFGSYSKVLPVTTLLQQRERTSTNDIASLRAVRNVETSEVTRGARLDESLFKTLSGQDPVTARLLYREFFTFDPHFKVVMHTNYLPVVAGADSAVFRRVKTLPFAHVVPADDRDPTLKTKLQAEVDGILQWALEGFRLWRLERLGTTGSIDTANAEYRRDSDSLADFLDEACTVGRDRETVSSALFQHYSEWARSAGIDRPMTQKSFVMALKERGFKAEHKSYGNIIYGIETRVIENGERVPF